jgi:hypothetical protein
MVNGGTRGHSQRDCETVPCRAATVDFPSEGEQTGATQYSITILRNVASDVAPVHGSVELYIERDSETLAPTGVVSRVGVRSSASTAMPLSRVRAQWLRDISGSSTRGRRRLV